jgi:hypothetical protein
MLHRKRSSNVIAGNKRQGASKSAIVGYCFGHTSFKETPYGLAHVLSIFSLTKAPDAAI